MATVTLRPERHDERPLPGLPDREALMEQYRCAGQRPPGLDHYDRHIVFSHVVPPPDATHRERFEAVARTLRDILAQRWLLTRQTHDRANPKQVYYLSMEFLMGRTFSNALIALELHDTVFMENPLVVIAARSTRLPARPTLAQLKDQRFILREPGSGTRMATDRHFAKRRFRPDVRLELGSNEAIREAVAGGLGLGVISRHALQVGKDIRVVDVEGFPISSRWHVVHPRAKHLSPIATAFRAHLLAHAGKP